LEGQEVNIASSENTNIPLVIFLKNA
jgi:hypothetical protein